MFRLMYITFTTTSYDATLALLVTKKTITHVSKIYLKIDALCATFIHPYNIVRYNHGSKLFC